MCWYNSAVNAQEWLDESTGYLMENGVGTARLDCLVLLEDATEKNRAWLLAHPEFEISEQQTDTLNKHLHRRVKHEPLAYVRGKTEFYGREFIVNSHVLEPRPESETMIDMLKALLQHNSPQKEVRPLKDVSRQRALDKDSEYTIVDVGTGSGAIGLTVALEITGSSLTLIDIDEKCLEVANANAKKHQANATLIRSDLLEALPFQQVKPLILLCNLPYVPDGYHINRAAMNEPKTAIFGGPDGLDLYRQLFDQAKNFKTEYIFTESLPFQHAALAKIADASGFKPSTVDDFIQLYQRK